MENLSYEKIASIIDHTNLKAFVSDKDMEKLCEEAKTINCAMVAVNSSQVNLCKRLLDGTSVHVGAAISFPLGQNTLETKLFEINDAINNGADEIDYVVNLTSVKNREWDKVEEEMFKIVELCRMHNVVSKVIFENCYLNEEEKIQLCNISKIIKPDFIKTSTGFGISGASIKDIILMKGIVKDEVKVKAAGGIRDLKTFINMVEAGADRIGTSSSLKILEEFKNENSN